MVEQQGQAPAIKQGKKRWYAWLLSPLWISLLVALLVRVLLIVHTNGAFDGDEALVGIQGQHILQGERPVYFYAIPYFGSLEAYLLALVFAIAGSSEWTLRAEPTLLSLVIVWLTWRLATVLTEDIPLPPYARRYFIFIATLLAAIPPLYDTVVELRTWGGYVETYVLMLMLLLSALQLTRRWRAGASTGELALRWAGIGFVVGLGLWVDPLIASAIIAAAIWILWSCGAHMMVLKRQSASRFIAPVLKGLVPSIVAIPACIIGLLPAIIWGATHQWQNVVYIMNISSYLNPSLQAIYPTRLALTGGLAWLYTSCTAPHIISGALPYENITLFVIHIFTLVVGVACIFATLTLVIGSFFSGSSKLLQARQVIALLLLFAGCSTLIFCATTTAAAGLAVCDLAGRYATPLMLVLPFFFATSGMLLIQWIRERSSQKRQMGDIRHTNLQPESPKKEAHSFVASRAQIVLFVCLLGYLGAQVSTYALTEPGFTFQSPYCIDAPASVDPLIAYMQQEHMRYAWADSFIAYSIVFKTHGDIIVDDPRPPFVHSVYTTRFPANIEAISRADRPGLIVFVRPDDPHPKLLQILDAEHVIYRVKRFPSQSFIDIMVVTPLNRTVSPFESNTLNALFPCP